MRGSVSSFAACSSNLVDVKFRSGVDPWRTSQTWKASLTLSPSIGVRVFAFGHDGVSKRPMGPLNLLGTTNAKNCAVRLAD